MKGSSGIVDCASSSTRWSIVTVTYNSANELRRFSSSVPKYASWIVVDNGSRDESVELAGSLGARVISVGSNLGFASACNIGARCTDSEFILFANPDLEFCARDFPALEDALGTFSIVAPQLVNDDGSLQPNGRAAPSFLRVVAHRLVPGSQVTSGFFKFGDGESLMPVCWVTGAAVAMRRGTFAQLKGWCSDFFLYFEDADLCIRAWRAGYDVGIASGIMWKHGWVRSSKRVGIPMLHMLRSIVRLWTAHPRVFFGGEYRSR